MNIIKDLYAREIFDCRGLPTIECIITLSSDEQVTASVPTGQSKGSFEPKYLYDTDRFGGYGVSKAVDIINTIIAPALIAKEPDLVAMDRLLLDLDGTADKSNYGANTLLAVSTAVCKAHAVSEDLELYECIAYLLGIQKVSVPFGMFNIINGGRHADSGLAIQEVLIVPIVAETFIQSYEMATMTFQTLKKILHEHKLHTLVGDEGGFAPPIIKLEEVLDFVLTAIERAGFAGQIVIGIDVAISQFFDPINNRYNIQGQQYSAEELVDWYIALIKQFGIYSIEDGLADSDWAGWVYMTQKIGTKVQLIGDDLFVSQTHRIAQGIERGVANTVLIKPSQAGTISETLQAIKLCLAYNLPFIVSHRSGETNDSFIADLALGTNASHIKAGGCTRGERVAKYNRMIAIEQQLMLSSSHSYSV
jgi:enolase